MEKSNLDIYSLSDQQDFVSSYEPYPSDDGEFVHVLAWPRQLTEEYLWLLTFKANPDFNPDIDSNEMWSDWKIIFAEYIGELEEKAPNIPLNNKED